MPRKNEPKTSNARSPRVTRAAAAPPPAPEVRTTEADGVITAEYVGFEAPLSRGQELARAIHGAQASFGSGPQAVRQPEPEEDDEEDAPDVVTTPVEDGQVVTEGETETEESPNIVADATTDGSDTDTPPA